MKIGFIGCGNMGGAIASAVCNTVSPQNVILSDLDVQKAETLARRLGCRIGNNTDCVKESDFLFLAVKPQMMRDVLAPLQKILSDKTNPFVLVTMAAGLSMQTVLQYSGGNYPIIRIMPNTPVAVGMGMIEYCMSGVSDEAVQTFLDVMKSAGVLDEIPEALIDAASCVSGCGPAWAYQMIEALADGGVACGLPRQKAQRYAAQMLLGSAQMVLKTNLHPGTLKDNVCSPGGSTIQGVRVLEENGFRGAVCNAVIAAFEKTKELGAK